MEEDPGGGGPEGAGELTPRRLDVARNALLRATLNSWTCTPDWCFIFLCMTMHQAKFCKSQLPALVCSTPREGRRLFRDSSSSCR